MAGISWNSYKYGFSKERVVECSSVKYRWTITAAILLIIPYIVWSGFRGDTADTALYRKIFLEAPSTIDEITGYLSKYSKDKGFSILLICMKMIIGNSDILFFLIIATFQMLCLAMVYRKYSSNYLFSLFLFVASTDYLSWMHNGMRQFIAVTGIFACTGLMLKKKYIPLIGIILLLSTVHGSALIMLPVVFLVQGKALNQKTLAFVGVMLLGVAFVDQFTSFLDLMMVDTQYSGIVTNEIWTSDDGTNIIRVLVYSIPAILSVIGKKFVDGANDPVINLSVNMSLIAAGLYILSSVTSGIYVGRIPIYMSLYSYITLPWLIENVFNKNSARMLYIFTIVAYIAFFYYQVVITWG